MKTGSRAGRRVDKERKQNKVRCPLPLPSPFIVLPSGSSCDFSVSSQGILRLSLELTPICIFRSPRDSFPSFPFQLRTEEANMPMPICLETMLLVEVGIERGQDKGISSQFESMFIWKHNSLHSIFWPFGKPSQGKRARISLFPCYMCKGDLGGRVRPLHRTPSPGETH